MALLQDNAIVILFSFLLLQLLYAHIPHRHRLNIALVSAFYNGIVKMGQQHQNLQLLVWRAAILHENHKTLNSNASQPQNLVMGFEKVDLSEVLQKTIAFQAFCD
ncbi:hypothetical protein Ahia01_001114600 [Argonauta hians]